VNTENNGSEKIWSPMKMLDLCYRASDLVREAIRTQEGVVKNEGGADQKKALEKLVKTHETIAQFTKEVQHVWDEYVELLDAISEARPTLVHLDHDWMVRSVLDQHDFIIRTWDREDA
jgi:hypothetical protein